MNDVTKSPHFQFKNSLDFPFLLKCHHKMVRLLKIMPMLLERNMIYKNLETVSDLHQRNKIVKISKNLLFC